MLVHLGASVNHETSTGTTALFEAAKAREKGAIRALVDCGGPFHRKRPHAVMGQRHPTATTQRASTSRRPTARRRSPS